MLTDLFLSSLDKENLFLLLIALVFTNSNARKENAGNIRNAEKTKGTALAVSLGNNHFVTCCSVGLQISNTLIIFDKYFVTKNKLISKPPGQICDKNI